MKWLFDIMPHLLDFIHVIGSFVLLCRSQNHLPLMRKVAAVPTPASTPA